jgi:hypothetical protein
MIPTLVIVHDNNPILSIYKELLNSICRIVERDSFQGEQLYGMFEGVIFHNHVGQKQIIRKDFYKDLIDAILDQLDQLPLDQKNLLKDYLKFKPYNVLHLLDTLKVSSDTKARFTKLVQELHAKE